MEQIRKLFFGIKMTWLKVVIFAVLTGAVTASLLICPATADTSLGNLGVSFEGWILFAIIIALNCEKALEAGLKVFVFFLISQPLIYLIQVPFSALGWGIFMYYPRWAIWTVLCLPGGMIAWYVKKDTILSGIILAVATGFLAAIGVYYIQQCTLVFPKHLLSIVFCLVLAIALIFILLKNKGPRIIALILTLLVTCASAYYVFVYTAGISNSTKYYLDSEHSWNLTETKGEMGEISFNQNDNCVKIKAEQDGSEAITFTNEKNEVFKLIVTFDHEAGFSFEPITETPAANP